MTCDNIASSNEEKTLSHTAATNPPSTPHDVETALIEVNELKAKIAKTKKAIEQSEKDLENAKKVLAAVKLRLRNRKKNLRHLGNQLRKSKKTANEKFKSAMTSSHQD